MGILCSGCASYRASPLCSLRSESCEKVVICAKAFDVDDCKQYLDRDVIAEGYRPVQLCIKNNSDRDYRFSPQRISLTCADATEVAKKVHTSTIGRAAGYGAAALLTTGLFIIPAVVDGVESAYANRSLDNDFATKAAKDQVIYQHTQSNMLLFIPVDSYSPTFNVTLVDALSKEAFLFKVVTKNG